MSEPGSHEFVTRSSRTEYTGAILALRIDEVEMPGGRTARREVVEHHGAVAVVARDDEGRIAMVRQYRHPIGRRLLELPAGLLDGGPQESPLSAAQRELAEEADLAADRWRVLVDLVVSPGFTDEALRVYLAESLHQLHAADREDEEGSRPGMGAVGRRGADVPVGRDRQRDGRVRSARRGGGRRERYGTPRHGRTVAR